VGIRIQQKIMVFSALAAIALLGGASAADASWSLVWSDEFDGGALDTSKWTTDVGNGCPDLCGWGNNELQWYRPENVTVTGGNLVLTAKDEVYGPSSFTSGKVLSRDKYSVRYGRIEMRAKLPVGDGLWPAFWMMPQDDVYGGWAASGEIDIMESSNAMNAIGGAIHFGGTWPDNTYTSGSYAPGGSFADDFHVYAIEWEADEMRWYVDDVHYMTRVSSQWYTNAAPGDPNAPFDQEFFIILNLAVGGWYPGCTDPSCITSDLPQEYMIDYVRVYEEIQNAEPVVAITSPLNGTTLPTGDITIEATASDADGTVLGVEFYEGANYLGMDTSAPYSFYWSNVTDGCYSIVAKAIDNLGGEGTDGVDITVGTGCGQEPYYGTPFTIPARIQAEDFDRGGEGVAYHDTDPTNNGARYRLDEGVDIENCSDSGGGYNVGWVASGEWIEYTIETPGPGDYTLEVRLASLYPNKKFHVDFNGVDETGSLAVPHTGNWQTWATVSTTVSLSGGVQIMRFVPETPDINLNWFDIQLIGLSDAATPGVQRHVLHPAYPNPFNPSTTIRYELGAAATVRLDIYDISGSRVRSLESGTKEAGLHEAVWNGRDDAGRLAPAGVYFYRLDADGASTTKRMTLVK
jgi:beta-glucanase (GH16 family)